MTEQEKRRRRREMERRMRQRSEQRYPTRKKGGLTTFRLYVTTILVGGCLLVSAFHTETSEQVCEKVKEVIAVQVSMETAEVWKEKIMAYLKEKELSLPVFERKEKETEKKIYRPDTEP